MTTRPDKHDPQSMAFATQAVHLGNEIDPGSGAIRTPLVMANSYALPEDPTGIDWSDTNGLFYTRNTGLNQLRLEEKLAALEHGEAAAVFATGVAALHGIFFTLLRSGDHVVLSDVTYEAVWRLFSELFPERYGITATFVDITDLDEVRAAMRPETKLVHTEASRQSDHRSGRYRRAGGDRACGWRVALRRFDLFPAADVPTVGTWRRSGGAFPDQIHQRAWRCHGRGGDRREGVDLADQSGCAGRCRRGDLAVQCLVDHPRFGDAALCACGSTPKARNGWPSSWRTTRSWPMSTIPGLESHPQHETAKRQFGDYGFGGMMAFAVEGDGDTQNRFVANLKVITSAVSLGHDESLIVHVGPEGRGGWERYPEPFRQYGHLRFSVGLEDPGDLVADLSAALDATFG